ncbi:MAG: PAS domain-containing protein, partial [bacterium]
AFIYTSPSHKKLLGYDLPELLGVKLSSLVHSEDQEQLNAVFEDTGRSGGARVVEFRIKNKEGQWRVLESSGNWVKDEHGDPRMGVIVSRDITGRRRSERLKDVIASLGQKLSAVVTPKEAADAVTAAADELLGWDACFLDLYDEEENRLFGLTYIDTVDGVRKEYPSMYANEMRRPGKMYIKVLREGPQLLLRDDSSKAENMITWGNVSRRSASLMYVPIREKGEKNIGVLSIQSYTPHCYSREDSELLQVLGDFCSAALDRTFSATLLKESEERFRQLTENIREVFWLGDPVKNQIIYVSPAYEELWGRSVESCYSEPSKWTEAIHPEDRDRLVVKAGSASSTQKREEIYRIVRPDGTIRWIRDRSFPIRDESGQVTRIAGIAEDITDRKNAEEEIQRQLKRLMALRTIDASITGSVDLRVTLNVFLDQITSQLEVDAADILMVNPDTQRLDFAAGRGFLTDVIRKTKLRIGEGYAGRVALERKAMSLPDISVAIEDFRRPELLAGEKFVSYYAIPLHAKGRVKGVLEIFHRTHHHPGPGWTSFLETLAGQAAVAIDNASLFDDLQRSNFDLTLAYDRTLENWVQVLDLRSQEPEGHMRRVTDMTVRLARTLGIASKELGHVRRGALLHDIGKIQIPEKVLLKSGPLTDQEWELVKQHPTYAFQMMSPISFLRPALDIPYCHHEKMDGSGYPRGLKGLQIPLSARIFAVVEMWDIMRSDRPYRKGWSTDEARDHIRSISGNYLDPEVVEVFENLLEAPTSTEG